MPDLILTDQNFSERALKSPEPILVDFWAEWCMPCQMIVPILQEIAEEFGENLKIGKLDIDKNPLISSVFLVDAIPTLILFKDGKIARRFTGVQPKDIIADAVRSVIYLKK